MIKKSLPWFVIGFFSLLLIAGFAMKDKLNNHISEMMKLQASYNLSALTDSLAGSLYNYTASGEEYEITFLEFGAENCPSCRRMEGVMDDIRSQYPISVNVVFHNVLQPESQVYMKHYGVASIPTQILLNRKGEEYFRHMGYISSNDLIAQIKTVLSVND